MIRAGLTLAALAAALAAALVAAAPARAQTPVTARTIRAQTILAPSDLTTMEGEVPGAILELDAIVGQEARVALYAGRPIMPGDVGPPAVVDRNQIVRLVHDAGGLSIVTEGRALGRGGVGDVLRVMNLASRATVTGVVRPDGTVAVGAAPGV